VTTPAPPEPSAVPSSRRGPRGPVAVYGAASAAVLLLIATLALTTPGAAPPAIAAFAPQSLHQIKHAPDNQSGSVGNPGGAPIPVSTPNKKPSPTPSATPPPPALPPPPKTFTCVGNPPRQTADPQSPPCVSSWQGNNGGATTHGVTGTAIRVYMPPLFDNNEYSREVRDLQQYFNTHFEFYGRRLDLAPQQTGSGAEPSATGTCSDIQAQADWVAKQLDVFAAADNGSDSCWYDELARNKVISLSGQTTENAWEQQKLAPYVYSYPGDGDNLMQATGDFVCTQLAGKDAVYSPDPVFSRQKRTYGLIVSATNTQYPASDKLLLARLKSCGITLATAPIYLQQTGSDDSSQGSQDTSAYEAQSANAAAKMASARVSTVICFCQILATVGVSQGAAQQGYHPEWITERSDQNILTQGWNASERNSMLMVSEFPEQIPETESFFVRAMQSVDPGFCPCATALDFLYGQLTYWQLLMLSSGIQMAGPHLTPYTFEHGLQSTSFPNPEDPLHEGIVDFGSGHSMVGDFSISWWNNGAQSPYGGDPPGSWCYAVNGRRFRVGAFPTSSVLPANLASAPCKT